MGTLQDFGSPMSMSVFGMGENPLHSISKLLEVPAAGMISLPYGDYPVLGSAGQLGDHIRHHEAFSQ